MAELERLVQRLEADTDQFNAAMRGAQGSMRETGRRSTRTANQIERAFGLASHSAQESSRRITTAYSHSFRGSLQNTSFQIADIAVQLEAGASPARVFAQQGSQILAAWGPVGAVAGAAVAVLGGLSGVLLGLVGHTGDAGQAAKDYEEALDRLSEAIGEQAGDIEELRSAYASLTDQQRALTELTIETSLRRGQAALERQGEEVDRLIDRLAALGRIDIDPEFATQLAQIGVELPGERLQTQIRELVEARRAGLLTIEETAIRANEILADVADADLAALADQFLGPATRAEELRTAIDEARRALELLGRATLPGAIGPAGLGPPSLAEQRIGPPLEQRRGGDRRRQLDFEDDIIARIAEENALLADQTIAREQISQILRAEKALNRDLTEDERERLVAILNRQAILQAGREGPRQVARPGGPMIEFPDQEDIDRAQIAARNAAEEIDRIGRSAESVAAGGLTEMVFRAEDLNSAFGIVLGTLEQMAQVITRIALEESLSGTFSDFFSGLFSGAAGSGGGAVEAGTGAIAVAQHGARTRPGQPFVVGEAGTELFVPDVSGEIIPHGEFGGGGTSITSIHSPTFNIDARGADPSVVPRIEAAMDRKLAEFDARFLDQTARDPRRRSAMNIRTGRAR